MQVCIAANNLIRVVPLRDEGGGDARSNEKAHRFRFIIGPGSRVPSGVGHSTRNTLR
jgi:hypothetical protein